MCHVLLIREKGQSWDGQGHIGVDLPGWSSSTIKRESRLRLELGLEVGVDFPWTFQGVGEQVVVGKGGMRKAWCRGRAMWLQHKGVGELEVSDGADFWRILNASK